MSQGNFRKILFAVDTSEASRTATPEVARLAALIGAEVAVAYVWSPEAGSLRGRWPADGPPEARALLADVVEELGAAGVAATSQLRGAPGHQVAEEVVSAATEEGADLIAVGSRGLSDVRGLFLGSVSHRVIALSDRPVLVVRQGRPGPAAPARRILLAVAAGPEVPHAVAAAEAIARAADAEVLVLHAQHLVQGDSDAAVPAPAETPEAMVARIARELTGAGVRAVTEMPVANAGVPREIVEEARSWNADLIVLGSRRLSDFGALFLGSVDHDVMRLSDRPVLVAERAEPLVPGE